MENEDDNVQDYGLVMPFWIDTDAYTDRDKLMFCCGYEFGEVRLTLFNPDAASLTIHRENESRIRMMAAKMGRAVQIKACEAEHDPDGTWSYLTVAPDLREGKQD